MYSGHNQVQDNTIKLPLAPDTNLSYQQPIPTNSDSLNDSGDNLRMRDLVNDYRQCRQQGNTALSSLQQAPPTTPEKDIRRTDDIAVPLTPTANLKMLASAVSPALRHREERKRLFTDLQTSSSNCSESGDSIEGKSVTCFNRKEKSLGLLCQRFLARYPENPAVGQHIEICLDHVARELNVERRRIYDIVNVLESVEIVSRQGKNTYVWHGKRKIASNLAKLRAHLKPATRGLENIDFSNISFRQDGNISKRPSPMEVKKENCSTRKENARKDKSLGMLSQKFIMMFMASATEIVTLDEAAQVLIGKQPAEKDSSKFKTKVRRLYDIANILSSLRMIEKTHVAECTKGKKPAFKWIGLNFKTLSDTEKPFNAMNSPERAAVQSLRYLSSRNGQSDVGAPPKAILLPRTNIDDCPKKRERSISANSLDNSLNSNYGDDSENNPAGHFAAYRNGENLNKRMKLENPNNRHGSPRKRAQFGGEDLANIPSNVSPNSAWYTTGPRSCPAVAITPLANLMMTNVPTNQRTDIDLQNVPSTNWSNNGSNSSSPTADWENKTGRESSSSIVMPTTKVTTTTLSPWHLAPVVTVGSQPCILISEPTVTVATPGAPVTAIPQQILVTDSQGVKAISNNGIPTTARIITSPLQNNSLLPVHIATVNGGLTAPLQSNYYHTMQQQRINSNNNSSSIVVGGHLEGSQHLTNQQPDNNSPNKRDYIDATKSINCTDAADYHGCEGKQ